MVDAQDTVQLGNYPGLVPPQDRPDEERGIAPSFTEKAKAQLEEYSANSVWGTFFQESHGAIQFESEVQKMQEEAIKANEKSLTPAELEKATGYPFKDSMPLSVAQVLALRRKDAEQREYLLQRGEQLNPTGALVNLGTSLVSGISDPTNLIVGAATGFGMSALGLASTGIKGFALSSLENTVGNLIVDIPVYQARKGLGEDVNIGETVQQSIIGGVAGTAVMGAVSKGVGFTGKQLGRIPGVSSTLEAASEFRYKVNDTVGASLGTLKRYINGKLTDAQVERNLTKVISAVENGDMPNIQEIVDYQNARDRGHVGTPDEDLSDYTFEKVDAAQGGTYLQPIDSEGNILDWESTDKASIANNTVVDSDGQPTGKVRVMDVAEDANIARGDFTPDKLTEGALIAAAEKLGFRFEVRPDETLADAMDRLVIEAMDQRILGTDAQKAISESMSESGIDGVQTTKLVNGEEVANGLIPFVDNEKIKTRAIVDPDSSSTFKEPIKEAFIEPAKNELSPAVQNMVDQPTVTPEKIATATQEKVGMLKQYLDEQAKTDVNLRNMLDKIDSEYIDDRSLALASEQLYGCLLR